MVYIYRKTVGNKEYFYLRASARKDGKGIVKDILYLGDNLDSLREKLNNLPSKYSKEIRKTYKTINQFIEVNLYLRAIKNLKLKKDEFLDKDLLEKVEACKLHWQTKFSKIDEITKKEILKNFVIDFAFNTTSIE